MICTYKHSTGHNCFAPTNGWTKPCNECHKKEEIQTWIDTPEQQATIKQANEFMDKLVGEKDT
jgi:hypothetical protein